MGYSYMRYSFMYIWAIKQTAMNPHYQYALMSFAISEDIKALIDVREIPSCPSVERQYQLFAFGFVFWLNTQDCQLTKHEKQILTDFRLSRYSYRRLFRHRKKAIDAVYSELLFVSKKLYKYYPQYQKWLADQDRYQDGWLVNAEGFRCYMMLNLPLEKHTFPKQIVKAIRKAKYRSLHEMLLNEPPLNWQNFIESAKDFEEFTKYAYVHGFHEFLGMSVTFQNKTRNSS